MASSPLHMGATIMCSHGASVTVVSTNTRVFVSSQPVATIGDTYAIAGCPFTVPGPKPQPCITARWVVSATRVMVNRQPAILQSSTGICQSAEQIPQGTPNVTMVQIRAKGL